MNDSLTKNPAKKPTDNPATYAGTARGPWAVLRAALTVVLGPAAATASALDQANAAPLHHPVEADRTQPRPPSHPGGHRAP
ncbi:hypothetical protein ABZY20_01365 [Streptomyces sp. NPDC006624]|uniref:hypothetical protein n=1 Tax=unclassified Streptomyces TaxID=2593676 RepID=UPI0033A2E19C